MKKAIYLATLLFALVLMNTSCTKDDTTPDVKTLEQLNPTWASLTNGKTYLTSDNSEVSFPAIYSITIKDNVITMISQASASDGGTTTNLYTDIKFDGNKVTLVGVGNSPQYLWEKVGNQIKLNTTFAGKYRWVLDIN